MPFERLSYNACQVHTEVGQVGWKPHWDQKQGCWAVGSLWSRPTAVGSKSSQPWTCPVLPLHYAETGEWASQLKAPWGSCFPSVGWMGLTRLSVPTPWYHRKRRHKGQWRTPSLLQNEEWFIRGEKTAQSWQGGVLSCDDLDRQLIDSPLSMTRLITTTLGTKGLPGKGHCHMVLIHWSYTVKTGV